MTTPAAPTAVPGTPGRVFVARLEGMAVFDPLGDQVGAVSDVVVVSGASATTSPRAVGLVVEVPGRRRVFVAMTRVTSIHPGQLIITGLVNLRRFEQRATEPLVLGQLLGRRVRLREGGRQVVVQDVAIAPTRARQWRIEAGYVRPAECGGALPALGRLTRRTRTPGELLDHTAVDHLIPSAPDRVTTDLLASLEDLRPAEAAEAVMEMSAADRLLVCSALDVERLADVLEQLPESEQTKAITNYLAGRLSDRFGRKHVLVGGWIIAAPGPFLLMWAPSWGWVLAANALLGVSQGLTWSTTVIMKIDLAGPERRGLAMGFNEFAGYFAVAGSALTTSYLAGRYGLRPEPFYLGVGFVAVGLILSVVLGRETKHHVVAETKLHGELPPAATPTQREVFLRTSFLDKDLSSVSQAGLVNNLNDGMAWGLFPLFFASANLSIQQIGVLAATGRSTTTAATPAKTPSSATPRPCGSSTTSAAAWSLSATRTPATD